MNEINKKPLVDILSEMTSKVVVMSEDSYVYLDGYKMVDTKLVQEAITKQEEEYIKAMNEKLVAEAKRLKQEALDNIIVEVNNKVFDGNETARVNMTNAIMASGIGGLMETEWKLANNDVVTVTLDELKEALAKAIQEVGNIVKGK